MIANVADAMVVIREQEAKIKRLMAKNDKQKEVIAFADEELSRLKTGKESQLLGEIDRLTSALARAHEALEEIVDDLENRNDSGYFSCQIATILDVIADKDGQLAYEQWQRMETVADIAMKAIADEPEFPDVMPEEMWNVVRGSKDVAELAFRLTVKDTKE